MSIRIQLKLPHNKTQIITLNCSDTFHQLQLHIKHIANIDIEQQELITGYPPRPIDTSNTSSTLHELNIKSGDRVIVNAVPHSNHHTPAQTIPINHQSINNKSDNTSIDNNIVPLKRVVIDDDNSCLFHSINYALHGKYNSQLSQQLRDNVADEVVNNSSRYDTVYLDSKSHSQYASYIRNRSQWGGSVELYILSQYYNICIITIDIESLQPYRYNDTAPQCVYLVYSGIHYDTLVDDLGMNDSFVELRRFDTSDLITLKRALKATQLLQSKRQYTNLNKFTIRCTTCKNGFIGAADAQQHAADTKHQNFEEYI